MTGVQARNKVIWVLVSNDLTHDQRVLKTCETLEEAGYLPHLVGRLLPDSHPAPTRFPCHRLRLSFHRGPWFYAFLQVRLWWFLINRTKGCSGIWANDLDTLWPAFSVAKWHGLPLMYDSHELFTEAAGLTGRPFPKKVWEHVEGYLLPKLKVMTTVNASIADVFDQRYGSSRVGRPLVVRNMPRLQQPGRSLPGLGVEELTAMGFKPSGGPMGIIQGAFLDVDRGVKEAVAVLEVRPEWELAVVGAGPEWEWALGQVQRFPGRLHVLPKLPYNALCQITFRADWGFSLDKPVHGNYILSLPNKLFDYIHAGIPVVASPMAEVKRIVEDHETGVLIGSHSPRDIASAVELVLSKPKAFWRQQCEKAALQLNWEAEEPLIREALRRAGFQIFKRVS